MSKKEKFLRAPVCLCNSLTSNEFWTILFISCLALYAPIIWSALIFFLAFKLRMQMTRDTVVAIENAQCSIVLSVQLNRLEELGKLIEENPSVLYCDYQRRSLVAWCRYYKNTKAQELIIRMMKKYPQVQSAA